MFVLQTFFNRGGLYRGEGGRILAKIAVAELARGTGWRVTDVVCGSGPNDRPFEEQHSSVSIAIVASGTFQYRGTRGRELMVPGSILLGNAGHAFECSHDHGSGDRCIAFHYDPDLFANLTGSPSCFRSHRLSPVRPIAPLVARACAALDGRVQISWEELAVALAARGAALARDGRSSDAAPPNAVARTARAVRIVERHASDPTLTLHRLAADAGLSVYHFLRTFTRLTGVTPHQFALRTRLRDAAVRLLRDDTRVIDVALDSGFGDLSNFNRAFRAEFGMSPRAYRAHSPAAAKGLVDRDA